MFTKLLGQLIKKPCTECGLVMVWHGACSFCDLGEGEVK